MRFKISGTLLLNLQMPQQICYAKLDDELPRSKSIIRWKTSTYFLASLLYAIQTEYVKRTLLNFLKRNYSIPDDRVNFLFIGFCLVKQHSDYDNYCTSFPSEHHLIHNHIPFRNFIACSH